MTSKQQDAVSNTESFKGFLVRKFQERGETFANFVANSDYRRQSVQLVIDGTVASPRIRRDIARYLGYENWAQLADEFLHRAG